MAAEAQLPARITKRRDKKLVLRARTLFWRKVLEDLDAYWYPLIKSQASLATRDQDPAVRLVCKMLDKLLIEQREMEDTSPPIRVPPIQVFVGVGIERGTLEARAKALQHQEKERMRATVDVTDGETAGNDDSVRSTQPLGDSLS